MFFVVQILFEEHRPPKSHISRHPQPLDNYEKAERVWERLLSAHRLGDCLITVATSELFFVCAMVNVAGGCGDAAALVSLGFTGCRLYRVANRKVLAELIVFSPVLCSGRVPVSVDLGRGFSRMGSERNECEACLWPVHGPPFFAPCLFVVLVFWVLRTASCLVSFVRPIKLKSTR